MLIHYTLSCYNVFGVNYYPLSKIDIFQCSRRFTETLQVQLSLTDVIHQYFRLHAQRIRLALCELKKKQLLQKALLIMVFRLLPLLDTQNLPFEGVFQLFHIILIFFFFLIRRIIYCDAKYMLLKPVFSSIPFSV